MTQFQQERGVANCQKMASVKEVAFMPSLIQVIEEISTSKKYALVLIVPPVDGWTNGYVKHYLKDHTNIILRRTPLVLKAQQ